MGISEDLYCPKCGDLYHYACHREECPELYEQTIPTFEGDVRVKGFERPVDSQEVTRIAKEITGFSNSLLPSRQMKQAQRAWKTYKQNQRHGHKIQELSDLAAMNAILVGTFIAGFITWVIFFFIF